MPTQAGICVQNLTDTSIGGRTDSCDQWRTSRRPAPVCTACTPAAPGWAGGHRPLLGTCRLFNGSNSVEQAAWLCVINSVTCSMLEPTIASSQQALCGLLLRWKAKWAHRPDASLLHFHMLCSEAELSHHLALRGHRSAFTSERQRKHNEYLPSGDDLRRGNIRSGRLSSHRWQLFSLRLPVSECLLSSCALAAGCMSRAAKSAAAVASSTAELPSVTSWPCNHAMQVPCHAQQQAFSPSWMLLDYIVQGCSAAASLALRAGEQHRLQSARSPQQLLQECGGACAHVCCCCYCCCCCCCCCCCDRH